MEKSFILVAQVKGKLLLHLSKKRDEVPFFLEEKILIVWARKLHFLL